MKTHNDVSATMKDIMHLLMDRKYDPEESIALLEVLLYFCKESLEVVTEEMDEKNKSNDYRETLN